MSNIHHLKLPPTDAWSGEPTLQRCDRFAIGDQVIAPGTPGHHDCAAREGGPGEVVETIWTTGPRRSGQLVYVTFDDSADGPLLFDSRELRRQPSV